MIKTNAITMTIFSNIYFRIFPAVFAFLVSTQTLMAQEAEAVSPAAMDVLDQTSLWKHSANAAGFKLDQPFQYSRLSAAYEHYDGDFRRPQQGTSGNKQSISTEGNLFTGDYYLTGSFSYVRDNNQNAEFNASIIDPFRGMPYMIADLNASDWNNQHYDLRFSVTTPQLGEKWSFGLSGKYQASSGAKQRDVRAENYYYSLEVSPALVYSPSKKHHIGLNLTYNNMKEESGMYNVNTYIDQTYYELLGLGTAISRIGRGTTYNYEGDAVGAGLQYQLKGDVNVFLDLNYKIEAEDLQESFTTPKDAGSVLRRILDAKLSLQTVGAEKTHLLHLTYYDREIDGIQYITQRDASDLQLGWLSLGKNIRSTFGTQRAGISYSLMANRGSEYSWMLDAGFTYEKFKDEYLLPGSLKQGENMLFMLAGKKNLILSGEKDNRLLFGLELAYQSNMSGVYHYGGARPNYPTVTELEQRDFNYLTSNYFALGLPVTYSQRIKEDSRKVFFSRLSAEFTGTKNYRFDNRYLVGLSAGLNF